MYAFCSLTYDTDQGQGGAQALEDVRPHSGIFCYYSIRNTS